MKMSRMILASIPLSFISSYSFAFFCPNNFNQISLGFTMDQVQQACGKPDKQETKEGEPSAPQEWNYFVAPTGPASQAQGTLKTSLTFDATGKLLNISVNGIGVRSRDMCGTTIALGATRDEVKAACGTPQFVDKQSTSASPGSAAKPDQITTFTYNTTPPSTLTFTNGVLTSR